MGWIVDIVLVVSLSINVVLSYGLGRALKHKEQYDDFFDELQNRLKKTIQTMKDVDLRGSFEADDEVGGVFKQMQAMVDSLDVFVVSENSDDN